MVNLSTVYADLILPVSVPGSFTYQVPPELEAQWRLASEPFYPKIKGKLVPADIWDEVQKILAEYRAGATKQP